MNLLRSLKDRRLLAGGVLVGALLAVALWPKAVAVEVAAAARGPFQATVDEEGETRVRERFVVSAPVPGRVLRIELEPGDPVRRGTTVLATFLPAAPVPLDARTRAEAQAAVAAAQAALGAARAEEKRAEAALTLARSERERHEELAAQHIVSAQLLEARRTEEKSAAEAAQAARFQVANAEQQLQMARARMGQGLGGGPALPLKAPVDGVVLRRLRESESVVPAGEPLMELGDPARLEVVSDLLSTDAVRVRPGQAVAIEQWGGDRPLAARVRRVEPSGFMKVSALGVEEQRVNVVLDLEEPLAARPELGDGFRVEVRIVVYAQKDALKVPAGSLFREGEGWAVFVVDGGRARKRPVQLGHSNGQEAEVLRGLSAGERVVVHPSDTLKDGSRVAPREG